MNVKRQESTGFSMRFRNISALILAAGRSSRMRGADKLLETVDKFPLIRRQCLAASDVFATVLVALPAPPGSRGAALDGLAVTRVEVPDAAEGMGASIRRGILALPETAEAILILPGDMPELCADDLRAVARAFDPADPRPVRATAADGTPGHPVLFPLACFGDLARLSGDRGARDVLAAEAGRLVSVALPGRRALVDLDTPEDWADWRAGRRPA